MKIAVIIIGLFFMALSLFQLKRKTRMDDMIIQNYERKHTILDREKLLKVEHTSKALFGGWVALTGGLEMGILDDKTATIWILVGVLCWQVLDHNFKKPFMQRKQ